jgi:hypothetical protein
MHRCDVTLGLFPHSVLTVFVASGGNSTCGPNVPPEFDPSTPASGVNFCSNVGETVRFLDDVAGFVFWDPFSFFVCMRMPSTMLTARLQLTLNITALTAGNITNMAIALSNVLANSSFTFLGGMPVLVPGCQSPVF